MPADDDDPETKKNRTILLLLFVLISFLNALGAQTFSAAPAEAMEYFPGLDTDGINLLLLYAALMPFMFLIPVAALLITEAGLHRCIQGGAIFVMSGLGIRAIPAFFSETLRDEHRSLCLLLLNLGQLINAAAFPLFMASPSTLSQKWFPQSMRTTITAESSVAAEVGFACAYLMGDYISSPERLAAVLKLEFFLALAAGIIALILMARIPYAPDHMTPVIRTSSGSVNSISPGQALLGELKAAWQNRTFMIIAVAVGLVGGLFTGWVPLIPQFTSPPFSEEGADQLGFACDLAAIIGGFAIGPIADKVFHQEYRKIAVTLIIVSTISVGLIVFLLPSTFAPNRDLLSEAIIWPPVLIAGFSSGALLPISYEWCADLATPLSEGTSGGIYQLLVSLATALLLLVSLIVRTCDIMVTVMFINIMSLLLILTVQPSPRSVVLSNAQPKDASHMKLNEGIEVDLELSYLDDVELDGMEPKEHNPREKASPLLRSLHHNSDDADIAPLR